MQTLHSVFFVILAVCLAGYDRQGRVYANDIGKLPIPDQYLGLRFPPVPEKMNASIVPAIINGTSPLDKRQSSDLQIWITHWYPPPECDGDICSITSTDDLAHIKVNGQGFTVGRVFVGLYSYPSITLQWGHNINVIHYNGWRGAAFGHQTPLIDCGAVSPSHPANSLIAVYDWGTARWSPVWWLYRCYVL